MIIIQCDLKARLNYHLYLNFAVLVVGQGAGETAAPDRGYFMGKKLYKNQCYFIFWFIFHETKNEMCIKLHIKAIYFVNLQETTVFSLLYVEICPMRAGPWVFCQPAAQATSRHWL